jgi:hypothetical protein
MAKMTFGFRNVNGTAFDMRVLEAPNGRWPSDRTVRSLRSFVIDKMNEAGKRAERIAKSPGWSPRLTGRLVNSIHWIDAAGGNVLGRVLSGALSVGVPYGRRQEFEHKTRGRYLARALEAAFPDFVSELRNRNILEDVIFGRRKMEGGGGRF